MGSSGSYACRIAALLLSGGWLHAQVDPDLAASYFDEARRLAEREGGRLWGVGLEGPMVFFDAATGTIALNEEEPEEPRPRTLGFANAIAEWGGKRWSTYVWSMLPKEDEAARGRLLVHELFHRVQEELGLMAMAGPNSHLDTLEGRYLLQLEWRALARALTQTGAPSVAALGDALRFRAERQLAFPGSSETERADELREGLAQYTAIVAVASSAQEASRVGVDQLQEFATRPSFVATFAYASGSAYGLLLDRYEPGWTRRIASDADLAERTRMESGAVPATDLAEAEARYGGGALRAAERKREADHLARVAEFRRRFVEGPVLVLPRVRRSSSLTAGRTAIPGEGTMYPGYRASPEWGELEADWVLVPEDRSRVVVTAVTRTEGSELSGEGWTITLNPGWVLGPGPREGDFAIVPQD